MYHLLARGRQNKIKTKVICAAIKKQSKMAEAVRSKNKKVRGTLNKTILISFE